MSGIFNGIQTIINTILGPIHWVIDLIDYAIHGMTIIANVIGQVITIINSLPVWITGVAITTVSVAVLYQLMGRSQGK